MADYTGGFIGTYTQTCQHNQDAEHLYSHARLGCSSCREKMVHDVVPLIAKLCGKWRTSSFIDYDDLLQTCLLDVYKATLTYDPAQSMWTTYATTFASYAFINCHRYAMRQKNVIHRQMSDILAEDQVIQIEDLNCENPLEAASRSEMRQIKAAILNNAMRKINHRDELIVRMRYGLPPYDKVHTLYEIGQKHSLTRERVRQITKRACLKISKLLRDEANLQDD